MNNDTRDEKGRFKKGGTGFWTGKTRSHKTRIKISNSLVGRYLGEESCRWKGGKYLRSDGYVSVMIKSHPRADIKGYVLEHIIIAEKMLGRYLKVNECVHHINGIRNDNRDENLVVLTTTKHLQLHNRRKNKNYDFDKKFLEDQYYSGKTIKTIADENNSTFKTIRNKLIEFNIKMRPNVCGKTSQIFS